MAAVLPMFIVGALSSQAYGAASQAGDTTGSYVLTFTDGGQDFSLGTGTVTNWRQQLDLQDSVITTTASWTAPDGHVTDLRYDVFTDRARPNAALVKLTMVPHWSGTAAVTDLIDGTPATLTTEVAKGWDTTSRQAWETVSTEGTGIIAGLASRVGVSANASNVTDTPVAEGTPQTVGQQLTFGVAAGQSYTVAKYVGVVSGADAAGTA